MKVLKYIINLFLLVSLVTSCEVDDNGPMPDLEEGAVGFLSVDPSSVLIIDKNAPENFTFSGSFDILFDKEVDKAELVVVMKDISAGDTDYNFEEDNQFVISSSTTFPASFTVDIDDIIAAIPALSSVSDIEVGDAFKFFVNSTFNGKLYRKYIMVDGSAIKTAASGIDAILGNLESNASFEANASVPCPIDWDAIEGTYGYYEDGAYQFDVAITKNPDVENGIIIPDIWMGDGSGGVLRLQVSMNDLSVSGDDQLVLDGDFYGYGAFMIIDISSGSWNTCTNEISFIGTPYLSAGASWGVSPRFTYKKK